MCGQEGNGTEQREDCARRRWRRKSNTEIQSSNVCPFHQSRSSAFIHLRAPVCSCVPGQRGNRASLCVFPYLVRRQSPCRQLPVCAFGVRCEPRPEAGCVFMCHRKVYSEGGVPWYRLWSGQAVEVQQRQWLFTVLSILNKFLAHATCFHPAVWRILSKLIKCCKKESSCMLNTAKHAVRGKIKTLCRTDWHQKSW